MVEGRDYHDDKIETTLLVTDDSCPCAAPCENLVADNILSTAECGVLVDDNYNNHHDCIVFATEEDKIYYGYDGADNPTRNSKEEWAPPPPPPSAQEGDYKQNEDKADITKLFKGIYCKQECYFVIFAGVCLSFNSGYVNGACLSGLLTPHAVRQSVAGFTGAYTESALAIADGDMKFFSFQLCMILSFVFGSFVAGSMTPQASPYRIEPTYGPTFLLGGILLLVSSVLAALEHDESYFFFCAAAANGIQNGISSMYSANLIRSTHLTGTSTDIGLFIGQAARCNYDNTPKLCVLLALTASFWLGGLISYFATLHFTSYSLLFNAALFLLIGCALVGFLVHELHISVSAALLGSWQWKNAFDKLHASIIVNSSAHMRNPMAKHIVGKSNAFMEIFDKIDADGNGTIEEHELFDALQEAGVLIKKREIKAMIRHADTDNDGKISREEWMQIALSCGSLGGGCVGISNNNTIQN